MIVKQKENERIWVRAVEWLPFPKYRFIQDIGSLNKSKAWKMFHKVPRNPKVVWKFVQRFCSEKSPQKWETKKVENFPKSQESKTESCWTFLQSCKSQNRGQNQSWPTVVEMFSKSPKFFWMSKCLQEQALWAEKFWAPESTISHSWSIRPLAKSKNKVEHKLQTSTQMISSCCSNMKISDEILFVLPAWKRGCLSSMHNCMLGPMVPTAASALTSWLIDAPIDSSIRRNWHANKHSSGQAQKWDEMEWNQIKSGNLLAALFYVSSHIKLAAAKLELA